MITATISALVADLDKSVQRLKGTQGYRRKALLDPVIRKGLALADARDDLWNPATQEGRLERGWVWLQATPSPSEEERWLALLADYQLTEDALRRAEEVLG